MKAAGVRKMLPIGNKVKMSTIVDKMTPNGVKIARWLDARLPQAMFALASIQLAGTLAVIAFMWGATK